MLESLQQYEWFFPLGAFLCVVLLTPVFIKIAPVLKLVDEPGGRKMHEGAVPLIGGLMIFPVFIITSMLVGFSWGTHWPLYSAILLLLFTGAIDDRVHLRPALKFFIQCCAAGLIVIPGGAELQNLGNMFGVGKIWLGFISIPFSVIAVVLLINAVNLMDGLDGLASGYSCVALLWMMFGFFVIGYPAGGLIIAILIAAICGFLVYNMRTPFRSKACIFLGDAGSMSLGLCLAWFAIYVVKEPRPAVVPISVAWVLAIPIMDTCAQFYRRAREGKHPFSPDRGHLHHHFGAAGIPDGKATFSILVLAFLLGAYGVVGMHAGVPQSVLTVTWILCILVHMAISEKPERYAMFLKRFKRSH